MMKGILVVLTTLALWAVACNVHAEVNFEGAELVEYGTCFYNTQPVECAVYTKDETLYLFYRDDRGIFAIYSINKGAVKPYGPSDTTLVWERKKPGREA